MMDMPLNDPLLPQLSALLGPGSVLTQKEDLIPYSFDGTAALQQMPACVVFAKTTEQVSAVLKMANEQLTPVVDMADRMSTGEGSFSSRVTSK